MYTVLFGVNWLKYTCGIGCCRRKRLGYKKSRICHINLVILDMFIYSNKTKEKY